MSLDCVQSSVSIHIWRGTSSRKVKSSVLIPSFGHVALETKLGNISQYISFWPGNCDSKICSNNRSHYHSADVDHIYEERPADVYVLKNLNVAQINKWFDKNKNDFLWVLSGSSIYKWPNEFNCAGLTYRLLKEGGLNEINPHLANLKKKISLLALFVISIIAAYCVFKYTMRPFSRLFDNMSTLTEVMSKMTSVAKEINQSLDNQTSLLQKAHLSLSNVYLFELHNLPQLRDQISEGLRQLEPYPSIVSFPEELIDQVAESEELYGELQKTVEMYSSYTISSGLIIAAISLIGIALSSLISEATMQTITPADIEDIVKNAIAKEKSQNEPQNNSLYNRMKKKLFSMLSVIFVTLVGYRFFKENKPLQINNGE